jgi:mono/diheme cytochrome c family protein
MMQALRLPRILSILAVCAGTYACSFDQAPPAPQLESASDPQAVERGAYLVAAANCAGCHTDRKHNGLPFAGGGAVPTSFGVYYSRNITPDPVHGIGAWSERDFLRALRRGVSPSGAHYFPAFPFPSFTGMTDRDILDIRAYLATQKPADTANKPHDVPFPYDIRATMLLWRLLYFDEGPLQPVPSQSPEWNRGNYLVNAVSHCGECHTPRNALGALVTDRRFAGSRLADGKRVPNITPDAADGIGKWSEDDIAALLKFGSLPGYDFVQAPMSDVVEGTAKLNDADRKAIAVYLKSLPALPGKGGGPS